VLLVPVNALVNALYPTLCRLHATDRDGFARTAQGGVKSCLLVVVPLAVGCLAYPDVGIWIFNRHTFGPAEDNLRLLGFYVGLVYVTMVMGTTFAAAGLQRSWTKVQFLCIVVSVVLDPLLVPWFQARNGNGGLGICVSVLASEVLMVAGGLWIAPRGMFDRSVLGFALRVSLAGAAMYGVAWLLFGRLPSLAAAPVAVAAYAVALVAVRVLDRQQLATLRATLRR
jgi:O-antigen/teichoic acid export membrane protein